jgi:hypothetical protein
MSSLVICLFKRKERGRGRRKGREEKRRGRESTLEQEYHSTHPSGFF